MKELCVLKPEANWGTGDKVFWYDHPDTGDYEYDNSHVRIYNSKNEENPFLRCHVSKIKKIEDYMIDYSTKDSLWGLYLKKEFSQFKIL